MYVCLYIVYAKYIGDAVLSRVEIEEEEGDDEIAEAKKERKEQRVTSHK